MKIEIVGIVKNLQGCCPSPLFFHFPNLPRGISGSANAASPFQEGWNLRIPTMTDNDFQPFFLLAACKNNIEKKKKIRNKIKRSGYIWALNRNDIDRRRKRRRRREAWSNSSMNPMIVNNRGNELKSFDGRDICRRFLIKSRFNDSPRYIFPSANEPGKKKMRPSLFIRDESIDSFRSIRILLRLVTLS